MIRFYIWLALLPLLAAAPFIARADVRATECRYFDGSEDNAPALTKTILEQIPASAVLFCFDTREGTPRSAVELAKQGAFNVCIASEYAVQNVFGRWSVKYSEVSRPYMMIAESPCPPFLKHDYVPVPSFTAGVFATIDAYVMRLSNDPKAFAAEFDAYADSNAALAMAVNAYKRRIAAHEISGLRIGYIEQLSAKGYQVSFSLPALRESYQIRFDFSPNGIVGSVFCQTEPKLPCPLP